MIARCVPFIPVPPRVSWGIVPRSFNPAGGSEECSLSLITPVYLLSGSFDYYTARTGLDCVHRHYNPRWFATSTLPTPLATPVGVTNGSLSGVPLPIAPVGVLKDRQTTMSEIASHTVGRKKVP